MNAMDKKIASEAQGPYETYRDALESKRLTFQHCKACNNDWLPPREDCPRCWSPDWEWRLPYNVALVDLDEGPRMVTNLVSLPDGEDVIGRRAELVFEEDHGRMLPRFRLKDGSSA